MKINQRTAWWVDLILFGGFLVAFFLSFTGIDLHQWIGIIGGVLAACHLLVHWDWIKAVSQRFWVNSLGTVQLKLITDGIILVGFALIIATGLVISTWLNLSLENYSTWLFVHILGSITTLLFLLVKLVLHWRWISRTTKDVLQAHTPAPLASPQLQPVPVHAHSMDRRDFIKVMGVASGASLLALLSATHSLASLQEDGTNGNAQSQVDEIFTNNYDSPGYLNSSTYSSSSENCFVQCGRRCSYPGHCRRYSDADNDNYCDLGECA